MSKAYLTGSVSSPTSQAEPIFRREKEMSRNSQEGYSFVVDDFTRLQRWLILGSEGGSYYAGEKELTKQNILCLENCLKEDYVKTLLMIEDASFNPPSMSLPIFALAVAASHENPRVRRYALDSSFNIVCRTAGHLIEFIDYVDEMRGWGRGLRNAIADWYLSRNVKDLAFQVLKYRSRNGWTHRDILRKSHPRIDLSTWSHGDLFRWIVKGEKRWTEEGLYSSYMRKDGEFDLIDVFESARVANKKELIRLILDHHLSWEMVPFEMLGDGMIWRALLPHMPANAVLKNLGRMTTNGALEIFGSDNHYVNDILQKELLRPQPRINSANIIKALFAYRNEEAARGGSTWNAIPEIVDMLENTLSNSFSLQGQPTGARYYIGLDVSASMDGGRVLDMAGFSPRVAASCIALMLAKKEPKSCIFAFSDYMVKLDLTRSSSFNEAVNMTKGLPFMGTDCSLPILHALDNKIPVDCFIVLTDNETRHGWCHPVEALRQYRNKMGINSKLVVVSMLPNRFTIADPRDPLTLDVVGFDDSLPKILDEFVKM